jgi:hypothetical protein
LKRTLAHPPLPSLVAPGASVMRFAKFRPFTGRLSTSTGDTLNPMRADDTSNSGASAETVTASCKEATSRVISSVSTCPRPRRTSRFCVANPVSSYATV